MTNGAPDDPRLIAAVELLRRTGSTSFRIAYSDDYDDDGDAPVVWFAVGEWSGRFEVAAALVPLLAVFRLCAEVVDGGTCTHCSRPTGFHETPDEIAGGAFVCWYQYDPELAVFRRGCE